MQLPCGINTHVVVVSTGPLCASFIKIKMKGAIIICFLALAAVTLARPNESQYTNKYDNIDLDEILNNQRLLKPYVLCLLGDGKCTSEGKELKSHVQEAMQTNCMKCTPTQRKGTEKVIGHLINHEPEAWNKLKAKYDPTGTYASKHEAELKVLKA